MSAATPKTGPVLDAAAAAGADESLIGGKALGLARLVTAGARVPDWWVLPVDAPVDQAAIEALVKPDTSWAVRSSAVGEDSETRSFAGLFDSFVFLDGAPAVLEAIDRVRASAQSERALAYNGATKVAVIVQRAVEGEVSGVVFTANPVTGAGDELLVSATWGACEGIVSGRCDADEYVVHAGGRELSATIAHKQSRITPRGEEPVPAELRAARTLSEAQLEEVCATAGELERAFGTPLDIEWTIAGGQLHILQARPITARAPVGERALGRKRIVWDNSNIQESFNGVTTPLTFSVAVRAYASVYEQSLRLVGVPQATIDAYQPVLRNMIGLVDGRVYYNIESWYRCLQLLPSFQRSKEDMERMMGLEHPVDLVEGITLSRTERLRKVAQLLPVGARLAREFRRLESSVQRFLSNFEARTAHIDRAALSHADLDTLLTLAERLDREVVGDWATPIIGDLWCMTTMGRLRKRLLAAGHDNADELIASLVSGEDGIESMEPTRRLAQMAKAVDPAALEGPDPLAALPRDQLDEFLARYGDRCMGEMKLETLSLRQDPSFIVQVIRNFVANPPLFDHGPPIDVPRGRRVRKALADARRAVKWRENMRLSRTRFVGLYRDIYLAAGERLHEAGLLDEPRDVLYLTREELTAYHEGTSVSRELAATARLRKQEYAGYDGAPGALPNHFETIGGIHAGRRVAPAETIQSGRILQGTGCSAGVIDGQLRVIHSPDDDLDVSGRILTALRTDPGWTPLFPSAAGILVERGSTLSHSAVLAREFGIPAVVGIPGLLEVVTDGERVRLDGAAGTVERLDEPA